MYLPILALSERIFFTVIFASPLLFYQEYMSQLKTVSLKLRPPSKQRHNSSISILNSIFSLGIITGSLFITYPDKIPAIFSKLSPKIQKYKTPSKSQLEVTHSEFFLQEIAASSGLSEQAKITVCSLTGDCINLHGEEEPQSVASLIKVPIAVALMHKVTTENISLNTEIYLQPDNFTEDNSTLDVEQNYSLRQLLSEMIINSSNIAPNQLIDYLSRDYINQFLEQEGYKFTRVNCKFIGDYTVPADMGEIKNISTSDELTAMMIQIYHRYHLGDKILTEMLAQQHDHELGFVALQNTKARWLGEKTGQNSEVIGTTLAMQIAGEIYIVTVIDDGDYSDIAIRDSITKIANYITRNGHL